MPELVHLPLTGGDGRPLIHKFFRQTADPAGVLVTFPGNLYGADGALLYYPSVLLGQRGWDTLALTYGFQTTPGISAAEGIAAALQECRTAVEAVMAHRAYPRVGLIGKSLGAAIAASLCVALPGLGSARVAYLTPLVGSPLFDSLFVQASPAAYVAAGTADPFIDLAALEPLREQRPFRLTVIEGADHSLIVREDLKASVAALERVVGEVVEFLDER